MGLHSNQGWWWFWQFLMWWWIATVMCKSPPSNFPCQVVEESARLSRELVCDITRVETRVQANNSHLKLYNLMDLFQVSVNSSWLYIRGLVDRENIHRQGLCDLDYWFTKSSSRSQRPFAGGNSGGGGDTAEGHGGSGPCVIHVELADVVNAQQPLFFSVPVLILDVNDNLPEFPTGRTFTVNFKENEPVGLLVDLPTAVDLDEGDNGTIEYRLEGEHASLFDLVPQEVTDRANFDGINFRLKLKTLQSFDREVVSEYRLNLIAKDQGWPGALTSTLSLLIILDEVNDVPPVFSRALYEVEVFENATIGQKIAQVEAIDGDKDGSAHIRLSTASTLLLDFPTRLSDTFRVLSDGMVLLQRSLDYEVPSDRYFSLPLEAVDNGQPPRTATTTLFINVLDSNDVAPLIEVQSVSSSGRLTTSLSTRTLHVTENAQMNAFVARVSAWDADTGVNGLVSCQIIHGRDDFILEEQTTAGIFASSSTQFHRARRSINAADRRRTATVYHLRAKGQFDREKRDSYVIRIQCRDQGKPQSLESVQDLNVAVEDENDCRPVFVLPPGPEATKGLLVARLRENQPSGSSEVLRLRAKDADLGSHAIPWFAIAQQHKHLFQVDKITGHVSALVAFDRELNASVFFKAIVFDSQLPQLNSTILCRVIIEDENDNAPVFVQDKKEDERVLESYRFAVHENARHNGIPVGRVRAVDVDELVNAQISYSIDFNHPETGPWLVNSVTGIITVAPGSTVDRERQAAYVLPLIAQDSGQPTQSSTILVRIDVLDVNDNAPVFIRPEGPQFVANASMPRDSVVGTVLYQVEAIDGDAPENAKIQYRLQDAVSPYFIIDPHSGVIRLNRSIQPGDQMMFPKKLLVIAEDSGEPVSHGKAIVMVHLELGEEQLLTPGDGLGSYLWNSGGGGSKPMHGQLTNTVMSNWTSKILLILVVGIIGLMLILCVALVLYFTLATKKKPQDGTQMRQDAGHHNAPDTRSSITQWILCGLCEPAATMEEKEKATDKMMTQYADMERHVPEGYNNLFDGSRHEKLQQATSNRSAYDTMLYQSVPTDIVHHSHRPNPNYWTYEMTTDRSHQGPMLHMSGETLRSAASEELKVIFASSAAGAGGGGSDGVGNVTTTAVVAMPCQTIISTYQLPSSMTHMEPLPQSHSTVAAAVQVEPHGSYAKSVAANQYYPFMSSEYCFHDNVDGSKTLDKNHRQMSRSGYVPVAPAYSSSFV